MKQWIKLRFVRPQPQIWRLFFCVRVNKSMCWSFFICIFLQKDVSWAVSSGCSEILQFFYLTGICLLCLFFTQAVYIMPMMIVRESLLNLLVNQVTSKNRGLDYECTDNANSSTMPYMLCCKIKSGIASESS